MSLWSPLIWSVTSFSNLCQRDMPQIVSGYYFHFFNFWRSCTLLHGSFEYLLLCVACRSPQPLVPVGVSLFVSWIPTTLGTRRDLSQAGPRPGERNNLLLCILQPPWIGLGHPGSASARVLKQHSCLTRARTPPSILPNSGEDERFLFGFISCEICFREATC